MGGKIAGTAKIVFLLRYIKTTQRISVSGGTI